MQLKTPQQITAAAKAAGENKTKLATGKLIAMSILAGAFIALGGTLSVMAGYGFDSVSACAPSLQRLLSGATFPLGLILVVVLGAELFTGNNATLMPGFMRGTITPLAVIKNWTIVWLGNFAGALLFVGLFFCVAQSVPQQYYGDALVRIATTKVSLPWLTVFARGIGANWCVCLAVWLAMAGHSLTEKMAGCWFPVFAFVVFGWEHCIANMFFIPAGMACGAQVGWWPMIWCNLIPATIGNIVGGALFVGCLHSWIHRNADGVKN